jgi:nitrate/TMAO reductase-like tetraheme cytochrome c subunit
MSPGQHKPKKKRTIKPLTRRTKLFVYILIFGSSLAIFFTAGGFAFAASQEQHDVFCSSCHTQPESTFYQRSVDPQAVDLASAHKTDKTRCIDCHSGVGVFGRAQAELLGAHNALAYYTNTAVQPAHMTRPIGDESCLKCHQNIFDDQSMNNHFHFFLAKWQELDPNAATCVSCHQGHSTQGDPQTAYLNKQVTQTVCNDCHRFAGEGG